LESYLFLNPYVDDPNDYIVFHGEVAVPKNDSIRGEISIEYLGLNRQKLRGKRFEWLKVIIPSLMYTAANSDDEDLKSDAEDLLANFLSPSGPYAAMLRDNGLWK